MIFEMNLSSTPFENVRSGRKTVELRLFDEKRSRINIGDEIIFTNLSDEQKRVAVRVKALYRYASFKELFSEVSPERCGFGAGSSPEEASLKMRLYYTPEEERWYGVLGIRMELVSLSDTVSRMNMEEFERFTELKEGDPRGFWQHSITCEGEIYVSDQRRSYFPFS